MTTQQTAQTAQTAQTQQTGNAENKLTEALQKTNISGTNVNTTYESTVQPPIAGLSGGRSYKAGSRGSSGHPFDRESVFDLQTAYQKHHQNRQQQLQQQQQSQGGATPAAKTAEADLEVKLSEEQYKAAKEEEKLELVKFDAIRQEVNDLIASQDWAKNETPQHVHELGSKLRNLERKFWDLKPIAERLVLKGRNKLAERVDLAEEELLHAILVVSDIYRNRVKSTAHATFPNKLHPSEYHVAAQRHARHQRAHSQRQLMGQSLHQQLHQQQRGGPYQPVSTGYGHPGHGHHGHRGYSGYENFNAQPYQGHPYQGYGGYY